jgi:excisionase family DNA binding protein
MGEKNSDRLLFTPSRAADELGVSRSKVYELIARGDIPTILVGSRRRIPVDALRTWIRRRMHDRPERGAR